MNFPGPNLALSLNIAGTLSAAPPVNEAKSYALACVTVSIPRRRKRCSARPPPPQGGSPNGFAELAARYGLLATTDQSSALLAERYQTTGQVDGRSPIRNSRLGNIIQDVHKMSILNGARYRRECACGAE